MAKLNSKQDSTPIDSVSLAVFKSINGIEGKIDFMRGSGRMYADTPVGRIYGGLKLDLKQPIYVGKGAHDGFWAFNTKAKLVASV